MTAIVFRPLVLLSALAACLVVFPVVAGTGPSVVVSTHSGLDDESTKRLDAVQGIQAVESQLAAALAKAGASSELSVKVEIDEFRLRTNKQIAWGGLASGGDYIGAQVTITGGQGAARTVKAKGVLVTGSMAGKEPKRLSKIVEGLVGDVVEALK